MILTRACQPFVVYSVQCAVSILWELVNVTWDPGSEGEARRG